MYMYMCVYIYIYIYIYIWPCSMWDPLPEIKARPLALEEQSLNQWTTKEDPVPSTLQAYYI